MVDASGIREHMEAIGADGGHVGTVDKVEGGRIKPTKKTGARAASTAGSRFPRWRRWRRTRCGFP